jgi:YaiO family outer membrane protein
MKKLLYFLLFLLISLHATSKTNIDSLYNLAIEYAKEENYSKALIESQKALEYDSTRADIATYIANIYAWQKNYTSSLEYIKKSYILNPFSEELYDAWLNILLWSGKYDTLLQTTELAESNGYKNKENIVIKKLLAYKNLQRYSEGISLVQQDVSLLENEQIKELYDELRVLSRQKVFSAFYAIDLFENISAQHLGYIDYGFKINKHTLTTRINYANRFNTQDIQLEADYYHTLSNGEYLYFNYGVGINQTLFPAHRIGFEYYFPASSSVEVSIGGRYLYAQKNVVIATGHIGKYFPHSWFAFRPFYVIHSNGNSFTGVANMRFYNTNPTNYWGVELGYGNSPDDRYSLSQTADLLRLLTHRIKLEKNVALNSQNEIKLSAGYAYEEFAVGEFRNRYLLEILFKHKF